MSSSLKLRAALTALAASSLVLAAGSAQAAVNTQKGYIYADWVTSEAGAEHSQQGFTSQIGFAATAMSQAIDQYGYTGTGTGVYLRSGVTLDVPVKFMDEDFSFGFSGSVVAAKDYLGSNFAKATAQLTVGGALVHSQQKNLPMSLIGIGHCREFTNDQGSIEIGGVDVTFEMATVGCISLRIDASADMTAKQLTSVITPISDIDAEGGVGVEIAGCGASIDVDLTVANISMPVSISPRIRSFMNVGAGGNVLKHLAEIQLDTKLSMEGLDGTVSLSASMAGVEVGSVDLLSVNAINYLNKSLWSTTLLSPTW